VSLRLITGGEMLFQRGKAYSQDLRERVFAAADEGGRVGQIARGLRVSVSYVSKVLSRRDKTGETTARPQRCHLTPKLADLHQAIRQQVAARPDATIAELRAWLLATHEVAVSDGLMCKTLAEFDLTLKKSRFAPPNRIALMSPPHGPSGASNNPSSTPASWSLSTRPGPRPT
jgi:transposase